MEQYLNRPQITNSTRTVDRFGTKNGPIQISIDADLKHKQLTIKRLTWYTIAMITLH